MYAIRSYYECIPVLVLSKICILYIPVFLTPVSGSSVITSGNVKNLPPSKGQHFRTGNVYRSGLFIIISWHLPFPFFFSGIQPEADFSSGSKESLEKVPGLTLTSRLNNSRITSYNVCYTKLLR